MCAEKTKKKNDKNLIFSNEYYSDFFTEGMIYCALVRSPVSYGTFISAETKNLPEGYKFFSSVDLPEKKSIKINGQDIPIFCHKEIFYKGQPVGILTGKDKNKLQKLADTLELNIQTPDEPHSSLDRENIIASRDFSFGEEKEPAEGECVIEATWESDVSVQTYSETDGAFVQIKDGKLYVSTPSIWISNLRNCLSEATGFSKQNIVITRTKTSSKETRIFWMNTLTACQCAVAAILSDKPVKLEYTRQEQHQYCENASCVNINYKTTVNKTSGIISSMKIDILTDCGAWNPFAQELADRLAVLCTGIYNCPSISINSRVKTSEDAPSTIDFSSAGSKAFFALENHINYIAENTGLDPFELRIVNKLENSKHLKSPFILDLGKTTQALEALCTKSNFFRKHAVYKVASANRFKQDNTSPFSTPLRGIGLASGYEGTVFSHSFSASKKPAVELTFSKEKKLYIKALPSSLNIFKIWQEKCSKLLGISADNIEIDYDSLSLEEPESPLTSEASVSITTSLVFKACEALAEKLEKSDTLPVTVKKSFVQNQKKSWNSESFSGYPFLSTSFGAMIIELELDSCTYTVNIRGIWMIADAGKIINPHMAEINLKNLIQEGLKSLVEDEELKTDMISIQFIQSEDEPKQLGNIISSLLPAAYTSALTQAVGKTFVHLPLKTDTIFQLTNILYNEYANQGPLRIENKGNTGGN